MIYTTESKREILKGLSQFVLDPLVYAELGEPLLIRPGDVFGFYDRRDSVEDDTETKAFFCVSLKSGKAFLRYVYVRPDKRGNGLFSKMLEKIEEICREAEAKEIAAVSTSSALPLYLKKGFVVKKSHVNYHNIKKEI